MSPQENLHQSLAVFESLNLPDVYKVYGNLAMVARDRVPDVLT